MSHPYSRIGLLFLSVAILLSGCTRAQKEARFLSRADSDYKAGNYPAARIEYLNVLRLDPKNAEACGQIGAIWVDEGDVLQGLQYLTTARNLAPGNMEAYNRRGSALLALGDAAGARAEALTVLKQDPGNGEAILLLSNATRSRADAENVRQFLQKFPDHDNPFYQLALGGQLLLSGDEEGGAKALERAATLEPGSPDPHMALASMYLTQKNPAKAADEFKTAADLSPPSGTARLTYAEFELESGAQEKANTILTDLTTSRPDYMPAWLLRARIAFSAKNIDEALGLLSHVLGQDSGDLDAHILKAQLLLAKGDAAGAMAELQQLGPPFRDLPVVNFHLAQASLQENKIPEAINFLNQAVSASPDYTEAVLLLANLNLRTGNAAPVVDAMQRVVQLHPEMTGARLMLASAYQSMKQYDNAIEVLQKEITMNPRDAQSLFMLGTDYLAQGNPAQARGAFEKAQELAPQELLPTVQLVDIDIQANDFDSAFKVVRSRLAAQPKSPGAQFLLGKIYFAQKDWPHAEGALATALAGDPKLSSAYQYLANTYIAEKNDDKAIQVLQAFLTKNPKDPTALIDLGNLYNANGQFEKARRTYEQLLAASPDSAAALNNLAYYYAEHGDDLNKAQGFAESAQELLPADPNIADTLAWILYRKGDYGRAVGLLQGSASKPPVAPEILYHLGMASAMMGNADAARTALNQALAGEGDFEGKASIPARLAFMDQVEAGTASPEEIEAFLKPQPTDVYALAALGDAWERAGEQAKAAAAYQQALDRNPKLTTAALGLAELDAGPLHAPDKAFDLAKTVREREPANARAAGVLGSVAYQRRDFVQAYALLQEAIGAGGGDAGQISMLEDFAWAAYSQGNLADARNAMQRVKSAAAANSTEAADAGSFLSMVDLADHPGQLAAVESQIAKVLQATPDNVPALMARARLRMSRGDGKGAAEDYAAALARFPDFPYAESGLASLYLMDPATQDKAYDLAAKAHKALPDDPKASEALAEASYQRKDYSYAVQLLQECAQAGPLGNEPLYYLGMALWQTKQSAESRQTLDQAVSAGLSGAHLAEAQQVLHKLGEK